MKDRIRNYLYSATPRAYYSILLNAFGFNALRAFFYNKLWKFKGSFNFKADDEAVGTLLEEGVVVIENFLPEDQFKEILDVYKKQELNEKYTEQPEVPQYASKQISTPMRLYDEKAADIILQNKRLYKIIEATARKKINVFPKMTFEKFYADRKEQINGNSPEMSDELHYDVPFNSMRAFLYLKPCNESNAAFVYGKKTHLYNSKRLKFEYYDSIKQSVKRRAIKCAPLDKIDTDLLKEINYEPTDMCGKENSLVIFNSMGMHTRGKFKEIGAREALLIDFRTLDTPLNFWMGVPVINQALRKVASKF